MTSETLRKFFRLRTKPVTPPSSKERSPLLPLGLSEDQARALAAMGSIPQWRHFSQVLERVYEQQLSALLRGMDHEAYLFQCGVCYALERVARLPQDLNDKVRELDARREEPDHTPAGDAIFPNTPYWDAWRRTRGVSVPERSNPA